ncbi:hypothetical protein [Acinetobacter bereziniae]|nr:hypothetical protein [Acinetobacter bereziniae]
MISITGKLNTYFSPSEEVSCLSTSIGAPNTVNSIEPNQRF